MANKHRGEVELKAGDKIYTLRVTTNALAKVETELNMPITEISTMAEQGRAGVNHLRAMLWAALLANHPDITLEDAGNIMDEVGIETAAGIVGEAFKSWVPAKGGGR